MAIRLPAGLYGVTENRESSMMDPAGMMVGHDTMAWIMGGSILLAGVALLLATVALVKYEFLR